MGVGVNECNFITCDHDWHMQFYFTSPLNCGWQSLRFSLPWEFISHTGERSEFGLWSQGNLNAITGDKKVVNWKIIDNLIATFNFASKEDSIEREREETPKGVETWI